MIWQQAGISHDDLLQAMAHCDRIGLDAFRQACHPGFKPAKGKRVTYQGRGPYEPRPLIAAAYALRHPEAVPLGPRAFTGDSARQALLRRYGFVLEGEQKVASVPPPAADARSANGAGNVNQSDSRAADSQRAALKELEAHIAHLEQRLAIARTARAVYAQALRDALQDVSPAPVKAWRKRTGRKRWGKGRKRA